MEAGLLLPLVQPARLSASPTLRDSQNFTSSSGNSSGGKSNCGTRGGISSSDSEVELATLRECLRLRLSALGSGHIDTATVLERIGAASQDSSLLHFIPAVYLNYLPIRPHTKSLNTIYTCI